MKEKTVFSTALIKEITKLSICGAVTLIIFRSQLLTSDDDFGCALDTKFWQAESALTEAREEINSEKYIEANNTIKIAIKQLGIPEDAPRCRDCNDDGGLYFISMEYDEKRGNIKGAAEARYEDFNALIKLYNRRKCHKLRFGEL